MQENAVVERVVSAYSHALNTSDTTLLLSLYSEGGVFMPSGSHNLSGKEDIQRSSERFFKQRRMSITFDVKDIVIEGDFAFVQAHSKCTIYQKGTEAEESSIGKDFFVLRKEHQQQWKVYRYMFNS